MVLAFAVWRPSIVRQIQRGVADRNCALALRALLRQAPACIAAAVAAAALAACIESDTPTIPDGAGEDFGDSFEWKYSIPPAADAAEFERTTPPGPLQVYRGTENVILRFTREDRNRYALSIRETKGEEARNAKPIPFSMVSAAFKTLGDYDQFKLTQVDIRMNIDGFSYEVAHWMVDANHNAFPGFLPCAPDLAERIQLAGECQNWEDVQPLQKFTTYSNLLLRSPRDREALLAAIARAVQNKELAFLVDCVRFPQYSSAIAGFKTECIEWPDKAVGP